MKRWLTPTLELPLGFVQQFDEKKLMKLSIPQCLDTSEFG
jgi:hypothetical protein